jgi:4-diphosphocytidyl-2-C-methyl-D-erythritol kinase
VPRLRVQAFAKINLTLRINGVRRDGYHDLTTTYQTIALHDTLTFAPVRGEFGLRCTEPSCPSDSSNLVWRAAEEVWRAAGRRGPPRGVRVRLHKRIPQQAGLGGGSSDAAAAIRGLTAFWRLRMSRARAARIAASLGADVPFFLHGGTAVGRGRGDRVRLVDDRPACWVVLLIPGFGVSTREAYGWWDQDVAGSVGGPAPAAGAAVNDLERPVAARRPEIARLVRGLAAAGARQAAMTGSGSTVFGLFATGRAARLAARALSGGSTRALVTRTLDRTRFQSLSRPDRG